LSTIAFSLAIIVLLGMNIYQYLANQRSIDGYKQQLSEKDTTITTQNSEISDLKAKNTDLNAQVADYSFRATRYDTICNFYNNFNVGFASNNFRSSNSIIFLKALGPQKAFTLTVNFNGGATISVDYLGYSAAVNFSESNWYGSTTIYVKPLIEGTTIATFSNDSNSQTFSVLIVVTK
jgi:hypothetical protein